ncbi:MAG: hypothetical protein E7471_05080 [Ruminococcaceae bacterium]|nr:hypothetical protein [Oscillospiraceae bacterium]
MKRKLLVVLLAVFALCSCLVSALANAPADVVVSLQIENPLMEVNGVSTEIDAGRGTKPQVTQGRTLVPIRAIIESFGGTVDWNPNTQTVTLAMESDVITLTINSKTAYLNQKAHTLDVAPAIINARTMLPIRFIAEGFNLGVAWDGEDRTVYIIRNLFEEHEYQTIKRMLPAYSGKPYEELNGNVPFFKEYEIIDAAFEYYSNLDELGRCDVCMASVARELMPTGARESISSVTPTGWINREYDVVDGRYLYNRCHLIGYQLTGENANKRNLITGTRYLNVDGMLPFENAIDDYIERTGNNVMYRVTPVFTESNLLADGVLLEAYSVEDNGRGIKFCAYCYNVQPQIQIDYRTGASSYNGSVSKPKQEQTRKVYRTPSGKRYHLDPDCGGKNSCEVALEEAKSANLTPCAKCAM